LRVIFCSKTFTNNRSVSHVGLGISATNTTKVLRANGILAEIWQVPDVTTLTSKLESVQKDSTPVTHVVIAALWVPHDTLNVFCVKYPHIQFAINCHSNVGFLQADPSAVKLMRQGMALEMGVHNFRVAANSEKMCKWVVNAYGHPCAYLPNLYYLNGVEKHTRPAWHSGQPLRLGCFGAVRPQKNLATSIAAAIELARELKVSTEIFVSSERIEGGPATVLNAIKEMAHNLPLVKLINVGWQGWPDFRTLVGSMHLCFQVSYTESFNLVTADGISEGVPSVVSDAIDWVPSYWIAKSDDTSEVAHVGRMLLLNSKAPSDGLKALQNYISSGIAAWKKFLGL